MLHLVIVFCLLIILPIWIAFPYKQEILHQAATYANYASLISPYLWSLIWISVSENQAFAVQAP
jgi:hypothetical protein